MTQYMHEATENAGLEINVQKIQGWKMTDRLLKDS